MMNQNLSNILIIHPSITQKVYELFRGKINDVRFNQVNLNNMNVISKRVSLQNIYNVFSPIADENDEVL